MEGEDAGIRSGIDDRLGKVQTAADEASRLVRNLTFIFLLVGLYVFIIAAGTDDETLFRDGDIQMPLLNVGVPVSSFYFLVPPLFLLLHFNLLLQYFFLSRKLHLLNTVRERTIENQALRAEHRWSLFPLPFSQLIAGREHGPAVDRLLKIMVWAILVGLPVALLLWLQLRFLPFQDPWIVAVHRLVIALDLVLIWAVYPRLARPSGGLWDWLEERYPRGMRLVRDWSNWRASNFLPKIWQLANPTKPVRGVDVPAWATAAVLVLSCIVAVHPLGLVERVTPFLNWYREALFELPGSYLHRTLDLRNKILVGEGPPPELVALYVGGEAGAATNPDDAAARRERRREAFREHATALSLDGRSFRKARLNGLELFSANLASAELQGANLRDADLQGAVLVRADLQGAVLVRADLQGANLGGADLQGADLGGADLQGAVLVQADLQGVDLRSADLRGANLEDADLQGAVLIRADLQGADLGGADLQGAFLFEADLRGAGLGGADLQGVDLRSADLRGADLRSADLQGAVLVGADLQGAFLRSADLQGAVLVGADLQGAVLVGTDLQGTLLVAADLAGADLRGAGLWQAVFVIEDVAGLASAIGSSEDFVRNRFGEGPFVARLELADLRGARIEPMTGEEVAELIARVEEEVADEEVRQRVVGRLQERLGGEPSFGVELPPALVSATPAPVRLDEGSDLADLLGEPMAPEAYEHALGEHLAGLACGEESNRFVAFGAAQRAFGRFIVFGVVRGFGSYAGETAARVLASALLDEGCKGWAEYLASLSKEERERGRRQLEQLAAPDGDAGDGEE